MKMFDGKTIRDEILTDLKIEIDKSGRKPGLAVLCVGAHPVCSKYVGLKKKVADNLGVKFENIYFNAKNTQEDIIEAIEDLNVDKNIDGVMVQMPIPENFDKYEIVEAINPKKDVDGLRFCCNLKSDYKPPVVLAIMKAIEESGQTLMNKKIVIVGKGFLVGWPLAKCLIKTFPSLVVADNQTEHLEEITATADILISAVGKHDIITSDMVKEGAILIDAGTTEVSGEIRGDIEPKAYEKASFYTPVPGGIGPVTIAMLFNNLVR